MHYLEISVLCAINIVYGTVPHIERGSKQVQSDEQKIRHASEIPQYIFDMYNVIADENGIRRNEAPDLGRTVTCIFSGR